MTAEDKRLAAVARRYLPPEIAERWIGLMRPAVRLRTWSGGRKPVGQLGGVPALPDGVPWPEWEGEGSLGFVASIDCGRLPLDRLDIALPASGTLLFFHFDSNDGYFDPEYPPPIVTPSDPRTLAGARVVYVPAGVATTQRPTPADIEPYDRVLLTTQLTTTGPAWNHPALLTAIRGLSDEAQAFMNDPVNSDPFRKALYDPMPSPHHQIGGHAHPVQDSVEMDVSQGQLAGSKVPYDDPAEPEEAKRWTLLAQIDTDEEAGMMWGDVGTLYWLIRPEDLAAGRFQASSFTWQCS